MLQSLQPWCACSCLRSHRPHWCQYPLCTTHTGFTVEEFRNERAAYIDDQDDYLFVAIHLTAEELTQVAADLVSATNATARLHAPVKHVFDTAVGQLERWLLHDGWTIEDGFLVRVAPAAETTTGVRDKLLEDLDSSGLDPGGSIARALEQSSRAFASMEPRLQRCNNTCADSTRNVGAYRRSQQGINARHLGSRTSLPPR